MFHQRKLHPSCSNPFIDNAFKHGLPGINGEDFIHISFDFSDPNWLNFHIENNYEPRVKNEKKTGGIGLSNVKQRLLHLYAPTEFHLEIEHQNHIHSVNLRLKLK
jgi:two-component system, LytTR family, sensor kinase